MQHLGDRMRAHIIDSGVIVNTIEVESLDAFPGAVDASLGGSIGDSIVNGVVVQKPAPAPVVPSEITMRQARLVLLSAGKLAAVDAAIDAMSEPTKSAARIEWEYSSAVQRHNGFVSQLGPALGLTEAQIDAMFVAGAAL